MREPIQLGAEDQEAMAMEVQRQEHGLSPDEQDMGVGIGRVQEFNLVRGREGPDR